MDDAKPKAAASEFPNSAKDPVVDGIEVAARNRTLTRPEWFPDWTGEACAIVASGPSTKWVDVGLLQGKLRVIAIKENSSLCPWADLVYGCDAAWWRNADGLPGYDGLKVAATLRLIRYPDIHIIKVSDPSCDKLVLTPPGTIGSGGNSGFQAVNMAVQFGVRRIILIGFDVNDHYGTHWYGKADGEGRSNPSEWNFRRWREAFAFAATQLQHAGIEVLNCSEFTSLKCFPKATLEQALAKWT